MTTLKAVVAMGVLLAPILSTASIEEKRTDKAAEFVCSTNKECQDIVSMQLDGMYYRGLNENDPASVGTLINRKAKQLKDFCLHSADQKICENYKNQLMLKYVTGLLDR